MQIKPSAGMLVGGMLMMGLGNAIMMISGINIMTSGGPSMAGVWLGAGVAGVGMIVALVGLYRLACNVDLAAARLVDGEVFSKWLAAPRGPSQNDG